MKNATIKKAFWPIVETMGYSTIVNGYFGGSNLAAGYLNDFSADGIRAFTAEFIEENVNKNDMGDLDVYTILENTDSIIQYCASEFYSALNWVIGDCERSEWILKNASTWLDSWGKFYIFSNADIACTYIIRSTSESEAFSELITRFESAFAIDEVDAEEDTLRNDNGTPVNIDYLVLLGTISGE